MINEFTYFWLSDLISQDKLVAATGYLKNQLGNIQDEDVKNEIINLSGRLQHYMTITEDSSRYTFEEIEVCRNKIRHSLLKLLSNVSNNKLIERPHDATSELREFVFGLKMSISPFLKEKYFIKEIYKIIKEINKTYNAISDGIIKFEKPLFSKSINYKIYQRFKAGQLGEKIKKRSGNCDKVFDIYYSKFEQSKGGLQEKLELLIEDKETFNYINSLFKRLEVADSTLFMDMSRIEKYFVSESKVILEFIKKNSESKAKERIANAVQQLESLRENLKSGIREIQDFKKTLGL